MPREAMVPEAATMHVLNLESLLHEVAWPYQQAFLDALDKEGFEITCGIPNLQLPQEIEDSIAWLADTGFGDAWIRLHGTLTRAAMDGTLVDLSYGAGGS
jgi:hypothetical protein